MKSLYWVTEQWKFFGWEEICVNTHTHAHTHPHMYLYLKQDLTPMVFFSFCGLCSYIRDVRECKYVERTPWKFCVPLFMYCDCFSGCAIHFWFKYLMTLIKQHLNFLCDRLSVPFDHIMSNNGWNELQWRGCSSDGASAAVSGGSGTRHLNGSHPVSGILPIKRGMKTVLLVQYVSSLHHFWVRLW